jgi:hypothetical protein
MMKKIYIEKSNKAVSEIVGMLLLLIIVISMFSLIYFYIFSDAGPHQQTFVKISGDVEENIVVLEHQGGEPLEYNTEILINVGGMEYTGRIGKWLHDENTDGKWNLGERLFFPFEYNLSRLGEYTEAKMMAIDNEDNSISFSSVVELNPVSDAGLEISVTTLRPNRFEHIIVTINVTSYGGDVNGSGNVKVSFPIPEGLRYINNTPSQGTYDNETGIWEVGDVLVGQPAQINIELEVVGCPVHEFIQLAMILDGSESTNPDKWNLMKEGLKKAINNPYVFHHDGFVELTVVEYGDDSPPRANAELSPTVIIEDNYHASAQDLRNTAHPKGYAPMGSALRLAADLLYDVGDFHPDTKQIIILVTDGKPDCSWIPGSYNGMYSDYKAGKSDAEEAREYLISKLGLQEDQDELNVVAVGNDVDIEWLNNSIAWPQPGYLAPPINESGWVNYVTGWQEFESAINLILQILLNNIHIRVDIADSSTLDLNCENDIFSILIQPVFI